MLFHTQRSYNKFYEKRELMMVDRIDLDMVRDSPFKYYTDGDFYCSEAVVLAIQGNT